MKFDTIRKEFGFSYERDFEATKILSEYVRDSSVLWSRLERIIRGRDVCVLGPSRWNLEEIFHPLIVADDALKGLERYGIVPEVLVTDLDCSEDALLNIPQKTIVVVHAHGDNIDKIREMLPNFKNVVGTCQTEEVGEVRNIGGFTDGDRAVILAHIIGARIIRLVGFEFENPVIKEGKNYEVKKRKLYWAKKIIEEIEKERNQKLF